MKIFKRIFFVIVALILSACTGILVCALNPSLTDILAEKVGNMSQARMESGEGQEETGADLPGKGVTGEPSEISGGRPVGESARVLPGINSGWLEGGDGEGYELPAGQAVETPVPVSGRTGYEPVQEEAEEVPEGAEALPENVSPGNTGSDLEFDGAYYPYYAMLEEDLRQLYRQIYANATDLVQSFSPVAPVSVNRLKTVFEAVYNDHPELFWLETGYSCKYLRDGSCVEITLKYNAAAQNLEKAAQEFEESGEQILAQARSLGSDQEKEWYVHDSLMQSVEYAADAPMNQSAYSALVQGRSVCAGYARAFQYLMQQLGIPCYYCTGFAGEDHAWNIIKIGPDYHNVDVTWDDTDPATHDYFNKTDREFGSTHVRTGLSVYLPACRAQGGESAVPGGDDSTVSGEGGGAISGNGGGDGAAPGDNGTAGQEESSGGTGEEPGDAVLINPSPSQPLVWESRTGADLDTEPTAEEMRQENLEKAGVTEEEVRDTLQEYYEDCGKLLKEAGTGDRLFTNVIPEQLWSSVERAYNNGDYWKGYVEDALDVLKADSFWIQLEVEKLGGGYYRLYHSVYTE